MAPPLRSILSALVLLIPMALSAQTAPIDLYRPDLVYHYILPLEQIKLPPSRQLVKIANRIEFRIVVSEQGTVESAQPLGKPTPYTRRARAIEMARRFGPWHRGGQVVRVRIHDFVTLNQALPGSWADVPFPFPDVPDPSTMKVTLFRGDRSGYFVEISGDGSVHFRGYPLALIPGDHFAHISPEAAQSLLPLFRNADFFSTRDGYIYLPVDASGDMTISLSVGMRFGSHSHSLNYDSGFDVPPAVLALPDRIEAVADTARWTGINENTLPVLLSEHWDFSASTPVNIGIYNAAIQWTDTPLIEQFLAAKAPVSVNGRDGAPNDQDGAPLCVATAALDLKLVERMLDQLDAPVPAEVRNQCLTAAARTEGGLPAVQFWIAHQADPTAKSSMNGREPVPGPFFTAVLANDPDIVAEFLKYKVDVNESLAGDPLIMALLNQGAQPLALRPRTLKLLLDAGADVNAHGNFGMMPVFRGAYDKEILDLLVRAGADVNVRLRGGSTPLIENATYEPAIRNLLAAGADPTAATSRGDTALQRALFCKACCKTCATLIRVAIAKRAPSTKK